MDMIGHRWEGKGRCVGFNIAYCLKKVNNKSYIVSSFLIAIRANTIILFQLLRGMSKSQIPSWKRSARIVKWNSNLMHSYSRS